MVNKQALEEMKSRGYLKDLRGTALVRYVVGEALFYHPEIKEVWLFGSYLKGYYNDGVNPVPPGILKMRNELKYPEISDIDLMADVKEKIIIQSGVFKYKYKIEITPIGGNEEKLLIWKEKFI